MIAFKHETLKPTEVADIIDLVKHHEDGGRVAMQRYGLRRDQLLDLLREHGITGRDWFDAQ